MRITMIGSGYVGRVAGACFPETGNDVVCVDADARKVARLRAKDIPIYEPGLEAMVRRNQAEGRHSFTTDLPSAVRHGRVIFIALGTPPDEDGSADFSHVLSVAGAIGQAMDAPKMVVTKSTGPVGSAEKVREAVRSQTQLSFVGASNPEFLKEGAAIDDFMKPDRGVLGVDSDETREEQPGLCRWHSVLWALRCAWGCLERLWAPDTGSCELMCFALHMRVPKSRTSPGGSAA